MADRIGLLFVALVAAAGCGDPPRPPDGGSADASTDGVLVADAGGPDRTVDSPVDVLEREASNDRPDAAADVSSVDAGVDAPSALDTGVDVPSAVDGMAADTARDATSDLPPATGECRLCPPGHGFCNGRCVSRTDPVLGCGKACFPCALANAVAACDGTGICRFERCQPGFADCNGMPSDGCEVDLSDRNNCGACGIQCPSLCTASGCADSCTPPLSNCGTKCVDIATSPVACGACNTPCVKPANGTATCSRSQCQVTCAAGLTTCGTGPLSCVDTMNDPRHCGGCSNTCFNTAANRYGSCRNGQCQQVCLPGWTACAAGCAHLPSDRWNCGMCGRACGAGEYCTQGICRPAAEQVVATGLASPEDIAVEGDEVFFSSLGDGGIHRVAATGGPTVPLAVGQARPLRLAVDRTHVYWVNELGGAVMRTLRTGAGTPEVVSSATRPVVITLDAGNVYWAEYGSQALPGVVKRAAKGANVVAEELHPGRFIAFGVQSLAVLGRTLYVLSQYVLAVPLDGGPITTDTVPLTAFAIDAGHQFRIHPASPRLPSFSWSNHPGDESYSTTIIITPNQLVATPCGALFPGGFLPLVPSGFNSFPGQPQTVPLSFDAPAARRITYAAPHAYWTEPGDAAANGVIRRVLVPM